MVKKFLFIVICLVVIVGVGTLVFCNFKEDEKEVKRVSSFVISEIEEILKDTISERKFSIEKILYNKELEIYDVLMKTNDNNFKVWCQIVNFNSKTESGELKIITVISGELMKYELVLTMDDILRQAQAEALVMARELTFSDAAIVSNTYDRSNKKYKLKLITYSGDNVEFEIDKANGDIKLLYK